jgi:uncharacterized protein
MPEPTPVDKSNQPRYLLAAFVAPMVVYMLITTLEPQPPATPPLVEPLAGGEATLPADDFQPVAETTWLGFALPGKYYPIVYTFKIAVTAAIVVWFWPAYRQFLRKVSPLAIGVGLVGAALWIGCSWLGLERQLFDWLGADHFITKLLGGGERPAYNPLAALRGQPALAYGFLAVRFLGLVVLVPVVEEAFLRLFLMRYVMHDNWTEIPFGVVNRTAVVVGTLIPVLYHPEKLAALVWFSLMTWLMVRTKNYWDCVVAHAITNLLLGIYVLATGSWSLW